MTRTIKAHFDGRVFVPDEPVDFPVDTTVRVELMADSQGLVPAWSDRPIEQRLELLRAAAGLVTQGPSIPADALRRENLYED